MAAKRAARRDPDPTPENIATPQELTSEEPTPETSNSSGVHIDGVGTIVEANIGEELSGSFLEYAMSVIVSRAIPDVRDGLKPVQRRILYSMWEQGLRSDRQHQKSAKVVGAVMGNYHPHGDCLDGSTELYAVGGTKHRLDELTAQGLKALWVWAVAADGTIRAAKAHSFRIGQHAEVVYRIKLEDGAELRATANHPFLVVDTEADTETGQSVDVVEWAKASQLSAGQRLVGARVEKGAGYRPAREERLIEAVEIEYLTEAEPMYDFTVDSYENLFVVTSIEGATTKLLAVHNSAIYDAMVRLAQDWSMSVPLVDGQGNFGSPDDGPAASRYCVTGDTLIRTPNGTIRIADIVPGAQPNSTHEIELKVCDMAGNPVLAERFFHSGVWETYTVRTETGRQLTGTGNHLVKVLGGEGGLEWRTIAELEVGQRVLIHHEDALEGGAGGSAIVDRAGEAASVYYDEITEIEPAGPAAVYSIRLTDDERAFVTNGFISHNTEARMSSVAEHLTSNLDENTVDFEPNFDGSTTQPTVMPAKFPNLLVNGASGIAVGMATTIAPHNLVEVAEGAKLLLKNPKASLTELMKKIPGPDFPTGGMMIGGEGIREAYETGKGSVRVRGVGSIEELAGRRRQIVITELPYGVGPERFIARAAEAVQAKKIDGVTGISDHTDRYTGQRIVFTLRAGVNPKAVLAQLYKYTPLEERMSFNHVALVGGVPQVVGLKRMLELWIRHALEVVVRRSQHRLAKAEHRLMLLEGLLAALDVIDEVVATIKKSRNTQTARDNIRKLLKVNEEQANYILEMPLRRLTSLEARKLREEAKELQATIKYLEKLLADEKLQREVVAAELDDAVAVGGSDRRTRLITVEAEEMVADEAPESVEIAEEECVITLSATGMVGRDQGGRRKPGADDILLARVAASTRTEVFAISENGVAYRVPGYGIPEAEGRSRGERAGEVFGMEGGARTKDRVVGLWSAKELEAGQIPVFVTASGKVKRLNPDQVSQMNEVSLISLEAGDKVVYAGTAPESADFVFLTRSGQVLRTPAAKVRPQGRGAGGMAGVNLAEGDTVIGARAVETGTGQWLAAVVTDGGRAKATALEEFPPKGRATGGVRGIRLLKGETELVAAAVVPTSGWSFTDARGNPVATTELAKRDASGEEVEGVRGVGALR